MNTQEALQRIVNYRGSIYAKLPPERAMRYIARAGLGLSPRSNDEARFRAALQEETPDE